VRRIGVIVTALSLIFAASLISGEEPSGATTVAQIKTYVVNASDLGKGWTSVPVLPWVNHPKDCVAPLAPPKRYISGEAASQSSTVGLVIADTLVTGRSMATLYDHAVRQYAGCRSISFSQLGVRATGSGQGFPTYLQGAQSRGFQFQLHIRAKVLSVGVQLAGFNGRASRSVVVNLVYFAVVFHRGDYVGTMTLIAPAGADVAVSRSLLGAEANFAIAKLNLAVLTGGKEVGIG
jgi:hypothetical protein